MPNITEIHVRGSTVSYPAFCLQSCLFLSHLFCYIWNLHFLAFVATMKDSCKMHQIRYRPPLPVILGLVKYGHHGMAGAECNGHARAENACSFFLFPGRTSRTRSRFRPYLTHVPSLASEVESKYLTTIRACTRHSRPSSLESGLTPRSILTM